MKAKVDPNMCNGSALCEQTCPSVFEIKEGVSTVKVSDVPAQVEQSCRDAAEDCPTGAISIME